MVGYAARGLGGSLLASVIAFTPSFAFVLAGSPRFDRIWRHDHARAFLDGADPAPLPHSPAHPCHTRAAMTERMRRVNESVRQVLAEAIPELKDPRIGLVTVTGVDTAPDLRHATVYVSVLGSTRKRKASIAGLTAAHGLLQSRLAREVRMKRTPQLTFEYDPSVERGVRMTKIIDELAPDDE